MILVNDGSDDGSAQVLAEYAERHPNYRLLNQPNSGGPADPCNKGIAAVRGRYFFVLGADDVLTTALSATSSPTPSRRALTSCWRRWRG